MKLLSQLYSTIQRSFAKALIVVLEKNMKKKFTDSESAHFPQKICSK